MPADIIIPDMGDSVRTGVVQRWVKSDGDLVARDEVVMELETDKITAEILAPVAGRLAHGAKVGQTVKIGSTVGTVDESASGAAAAPAPAQPAAPKATRAPAAPAGPAAHSTDGADVRATALARKLAEEHGVSLGGLIGTGPGGRVREQDVLAAVEARKGAPPAPPAPAPAAPAKATAPKPAAAAPTANGAAGGVRRERLSPLRARIAERLVAAQHAAAMLTTFNEVDMSAVMALRGKYKDEFEKKHGVGLGFMGFFVKAAASALRQFPIVNASLVPAAGGGGGGVEVEFHDSADIAVAVSTPKGLTVPVLRGCQDLSFAQIEAGIKSLALRAREGKLALEDLQGGTFTITNGGVFGSLLSTPILNAPQTAILGMHAIKNRPVENPDKAGEIVLRPMMYLALSYDHRLLDGSDAVQFLVAIKNGIERPERLLIGL